MKDGICVGIGVVGGCIASLFGGWDTALATLILVMCSDYLSGLISFDDQSENYATARIQIYLDNELEFESNTISDVTRDQSFTLDVQGVQNVRIVCTTSDSHTAYCVLSASVY